MPRADPWVAAIAEERAQPRLLLVDDDRSDRMAVRRALSQARFACTIAECDSVAALDRLPGPFDCILLDYLLPGATALDLLPSLQQRFRGAAIVVLTGCGDEQIAVALMKAGASDYLVKEGLDGRVLSKVLDHALALGLARERLGRWEQAGRTYTGMLHDLVEAAPALYLGRSLDERLGAAAAVACKLFDGSEAFIELRDGAALHGARARRDQVVSPARADAMWRRALDGKGSGGGDRALQTVAWDRESGEVVVRQILRDREQAATGVLGGRRAPPPPELADLFSPILAQIAQMLIASIENLRLYETARKAAASRDTVMAVVSHDLRSPLSGIAVGIGLLREDPSSSQAPLVLDRMARSERHMKRLLDDLLDVAQIDGGRFQVKRELESVQAIVDEARDLVATLVEQGGQRLSLVVPEGLRVPADRHRLVQVLSNLLGNAIRFTPRGGEIVLAIEETRGALRFSVKDSGPGIEPALLGRVFERYWRKDGRGLGLGLFIAEAIVVAHGGRIWAESVLGEGATFTFDLPRGE